MAQKNLLLKKEQQPQHVKANMQKPPFQRKGSKYIKARYSLSFKAGISK
jgi:hypothetical protein